MSALEAARDRWGCAEVVDEQAPAPLVSLLREFAELHADAAAGRLDHLLRPSGVAPGWWTCPACGRRADREGERGTARRWCTGDAFPSASHPATEMRVER